MKYLYTLFALLISLVSFAQPTDNAPTPTKLQENVKSVFSDSYTSVASNYNPGWGQSGTVEIDFKIEGDTSNNILFYGQKNYQGTELNAFDASEMEYLHVDIWVATGTDKQIKITPIDDSGENLLPIALTPGSWSSVDIPKADFGGMNWLNVFQLKVDAQFNFTGAADVTPVDIYFDNIYFWKEPTVDAEDATLSDLTVDGTSVDSFVSDITSYSVDLPMGTTAAPTVAATANITGANVTITQATSIPGDATVNVTSSSGNTVKTYTVSFIENAPSTPAPTPPSRDAASVASILSPNYSDLQFTEYFPNWCIGTTTDYMIGADKTWKVSGYEKIAVADYGGKDLSLMNHVSLDLWTLDYSGSDDIKLELNDTDDTTNSASVVIGTINGGNAWQTIDFDLTSAKGSKDWSNITQIILVTNTNKRKTIYFDNFYFYDDGSSGGGGGGETPTTTTYCDTEVTHFNIPNQAGSIILTVENSGDDSITVTATSKDDVIDLLEISQIGGGGSTTGATIADGVATAVITWATGAMPATTTFQLMWSDEASPGNQMINAGTGTDALGNIDTANDCSTASVKEISFYNIDVYPNPASNVINVRSEFTIDNLSVLDLMGRTVKQQISNNKEFSLDVSDLAKGVYLVKLSSGEKEAVTKFIKK
jgi:hypothetical protein